MGVVVSPGSPALGGLRVGVIAPPWVAVPPPSYGGTELVLDLLARGLQAAGCEITLFTTGDSTCPVPRRWHHRRALGTADAPSGELEHVHHAYRTLTGVDIVHDHTTAGPLAFDVHPSRARVVTTMHSILSPASYVGYRRAAEEGVAVIAISHSQRRRARDLPVAAVIHHGIDVDAHPLGAGDGGYVLFLGRMAADKGVHRAIAVARATGRHLLIAAKMWEDDEKAYFDAEVEPLLGSDVEFIGPVGGKTKHDLLAGAEALLNPIRWPEPFGLVMVEAMACGTPVLSFAEGAAVEILDHGRTGYLCTDEDDMAERLLAVSTLDRAAIRASTSARFGVRRMVERHLDLYARILPTSLPDAEAS